MGQPFFVALDVFQEQLPELGIFPAADQVQLHGEFVPGGHDAAQRLGQPVPKPLAAGRGQAVVFFLELGAHGAGIAGDLSTFFQLPEFRIDLAVPGAPEVAHFLGKDLPDVVAGEILLGQKAQQNTTGRVFLSSWEGSFLPLYIS